MTKRLEEQLVIQPQVYPFSWLFFPSTCSQNRSDSPPLNFYQAKEKGCVTVNLRKTFIVKWYTIF